MPPTVLAGPIVRRVERNQFWVWMATSIECQLLVAATVYAPTTDTKLSFVKTTAKTLSTQQSIQVGKNVFVSLFRVSLVKGEFPPGGYIEYEITANGGNEQLV